MKVALYLWLLIFGIGFTNCSVFHKPIPQDSLQLVLVIADSTDGTNGLLYQYSRESAGEKWDLSAREIPVVLGRNGLGWGVGLQKEVEVEGMPEKKEGDGRSPAGVFYLSSVFGFKEISDITMPYIPVTELLECIDDVNSRYYNQLINRSDLQDGEIPDWESSEQMFEFKVNYEQGITVDHNTSPIRKGNGSCIFIHNWKTPNDVTSGCTAMAPNNLAALIHWLDSSKKPVLAQLPKDHYLELQERWALPKID